MVKYNKKDIEVMQFISIFGKSFAEVLGKTFYGSEQSARNNISRMNKIGLVKLVPTGLMKPRNAVTLSASAKRLMGDMGYTPKDFRTAIGSLEHNMIEQIAYYHLSKIGKVDRKSVYHDKNLYHAVPDLTLDDGSGRGKIFIEVEIHQKSKAAYGDFVARAAKDNPRAVLYVCANDRIMKSIANAMMRWDRLIYIDINTMISNITKNNKVGGVLQSDLLNEQFNRHGDNGLFHFHK